MADKFAGARRLFPITDRFAYLHHAGVSPLSTRVVAAMEKQLREQMDYSWPKEHLWWARYEEARKQAAHLINARPSEIAFVGNTTQGLNYFARGIRWRRGDNVVLPRVEFPANVYPWLSLKAKGVAVRFVRERGGRILPEYVERAIDRRTRAVAISFVEFGNGFRNDLYTIGRLCSERGVFLVVDAIQGLGALALDVKRCSIDGLAAAGHKWLMAPQGTGIFYCSGRVLDELDHPTPGWLSVVGWQDYYNFRYRLLPDCRRYESAQKNLIGTTGLLEALRLINRLTIKDIEARILDLTDYLCGLLRERGLRILSPRGDGEKSGIVTFVPRRYDADTVWRRLLAKGFVTAPRLGGIRVSPHFYNTRGELKRLVDALP